MRRMREKRFVVRDNDNIFDIDVYKKSITDSIIEELVAERKSQKLTQQDIADKSGMKAPNVTRIESKKYSPSLDVLIRYARVLGKDVEIMLVDTDRNNHI